MSNKPTARDVARRAGVSLSTVDRVLNNRGGVAAEKERCVLDWSRKLGLDRALNQRAARTLRVDVLIQPPGNPFHAVLQAGFEEATRARAQLNMQFRVHHIDPVGPEETVRLINALEPSCDGLVIVSAHDDQIAAALRNVCSHDKPVITLATDILGVGRRRYIGPDNRKAGRVAGNLMGRFLGPLGGEIVVIAGMLSMIGHEEREMGFRAVLRERYPRCRVCEVVESMEQGERAGELVFDLLNANSKVRGVYNASAGAQPIVTVLKTLGKRDEIVFITHELTEDRRRLLREGMIDAIIDQDPMFEVQTVVNELAARFGRAIDAPTSLITPIHIHTIENC